jgi:hypothetical protein
MCKKAKNTKQNIGISVTVGKINVNLVDMRQLDRFIIRELDPILIVKWLDLDLPHDSLVMFLLIFFVTITCLLFQHNKSTSGVGCSKLHHNSGVSNLGELGASNLCSYLILDKILTTILNISKKVIFRSLNKIFELFYYLDT